MYYYEVAIRTLAVYGVSLTLMIPSHLYGTHLEDIHLLLTHFLGKRDNHTVTFQGCSQCQSNTSIP